MAKSRQRSSTLVLCSLWLVRLRSDWVSLPDGCNILADQGHQRRAKFGSFRLCLDRVSSPHSLPSAAEHKQAFPCCFTACQLSSIQADPHTHYHKHADRRSVIQLLLYGMSAGRSEIHKHTCIPVVATISFLRSTDLKFNIMRQHTYILASTCYISACQLPLKRPTRLTAVIL